MTTADQLPTTTTPGATSNTEATNSKDLDGNHQRGYGAGTAGEHDQSDHNGVGATGIMPLEQRTDAWLNDRLARNEIAAGTAENYRRSFHEFAAWCGPNTPATDITEEMFASWLAGRRKKNGQPPAASTNNTDAVPIRMFFAWANRRGLLPTDPTADVRPAKTPTQLPKAVPPEVVARLLHELNHRDRTIVLLLALTGMRVSELLSCRIEDYDTANKRFVVTGKGSKERPIPIVGQAETVLVDWIAGLESEFGIRHGYVFRSPHFPNQPICQRGLAARMRTASAAIGHRVTLHMMRHTAATEWVRSGAPITVVSALLGHASVATTSVYLHAADDELEAAVGSRSYLGGDAA